MTGSRPGRRHHVYPELGVINQGSNQGKVTLYPCNQGSYCLAIKAMPHALQALQGC
jgi:hypothetical protein